MSEEVERSALKGGRLASLRVVKEIDPSEIVPSERFIAYVRDHQAAPLFRGKSVDDIVREVRDDYSKLAPTRRRRKALTPG